MSLPLYAPTTKSGIIDLIYANTKADIYKYPLIDVIRDINLAKDNAIAIGIEASGVWQLDDSNQTDYPIIKATLNSGQRDYSFTTDENGNLILDIYRVMVADENGVYYDLDLVDQQTKDDAIGMVDGRNITGRPTMYDKTANGIFLDAIPNYTKAEGLKIFINREGTHYAVPAVNVADDTTSGLDGRLDEYLAVRPTAFYSARNGQNSASFWANEMLKYEGDKDKGIVGKISRVYSRRRKDEQSVITSETINSI